MSLGLLYQVSYDPSPWPYVLIALIAGAGTLLYLKYRPSRQDELRALAAKRDLKWLGNTLPTEFPRKLLDELYIGWVMPRWSAPHNVIGGEEGTDYLLAFDVTVAKGEGSYQRTIVARRSATAAAKAAFTKGYWYRNERDWHLATLESSISIVPRLIEPAMIDKLWEQLR